MSLFIIVLLFVLMSAGLTWYFLSHDRGSKEPVAALWIAAGFGFLAAIAAAIIEQNTLAADLVKPNAYTATSSIFLGAIAVGVIEEVCKFLPLALYLFKKPFFNEYTDGIIYFAIAGLGFGVPENILYSVGLGVKAGLTRIFLTTFFHAAMTAFVGYYLISAKRQNKSLMAPGLALLAAAILHGFYDFGLLAAERLPIMALLSIGITFSMTAYLFILYKKATHQDQLSGDSSVGHNSFCRNCGFKNTNHNLYCSNCGQRA